MKFLSVCSGIEAASVAWAPLGWQAGAFSEIEPFPCSLLAHHYPSVPNLGDMTKFQEWPNAAFDLLCGGTPCQSFSVAGLRAGLADPRGNLMLTFAAIADRYRPRWLVWENVPGVLSSSGGRDFGAFLWLLGFLGYGFAYRVLDAQYAGVPQRRRRVFVVGHLGSWQRAAAVLFERHSLQGNPAPSREAGQKPAGTLTSSLGRRGGQPNDDNPADYLVTDTVRSHPRPGSNSVGLLAYGGNDTRGPIEVATARNACASASGRMDFESETFLVSHALTGEGFDASEDGTGRGTPLVPVMAFDCKATQASEGEVSPTLRAMTHSGSHKNGGGQVAVAFSATDYKQGAFEEVDVARSLTTSADRTRAAPIVGMQVRRLTPVECERLQGFPDGYTAVPHRGKPAADGPRYKALGNSWAVPCVRWIGERVIAVEAARAL